MIIDHGARIIIDKDNRVVDDVCWDCKRKFDKYHEYIVRPGIEFGYHEDVGFHRICWLELRVTELEKRLDKIASAFGK